MFPRALLPSIDRAQAAPIRRIRLDRVMLFFVGFASSVLEISFRREFDLPLTEGLLVIWGLAEFLSRRLRLEPDRGPSFYLFGACCVLVIGWIVLADSTNGQGTVTMARNLLKYLILFLGVAWVAFSPSKERIAVTLLGALLGSTTVGLAVLLSNPDTPYLAKYHVPYVGLFVLAAWSGGRPFDRAWRLATTVALLFVAIVAIAGSARWSIISGLLVLGIGILPTLSQNFHRAVTMAICLVPLVPLLLLDSEAALGLIAEQSLESAADVERVLLYAFAHDAILKSPLFGIGFENFVSYFEGSFGHVLTMTSSAQGPHNQYAALGALFGVPAMLLYAATVAAGVFLLEASRNSPSKLRTAAVVLYGFTFLANEVSDDARLGLYFLAVLMAIGEPAKRSWLAALVLRSREPGSPTPVRQGFATLSPEAR